MQVPFPFTPVTHQVEVSHDSNFPFSEQATSAKYTKRKLLVKAGEITSTIIIIKKGILRSYTHVDGRENTMWIAAESEVVVSSNIGTGEPSVENIEAVTNCEVLLLRQSDLESLYRNAHGTNAIVRIILETQYRKMFEAAQLLKSSGIAEKYQKFLVQYAEIVSRIPSNVVASFLGIRAETLSRLRSEYAKGKRKL